MADRTEQDGEGSASRASGGPGRGLTAAQQRAVESNEPLICVTAGPGSGKTRTLVERVITRVLDGRLKLDRTLAITFTENAAAEMKQRLADEFERRGLEEQRRALESVFISTIHAFCARLLRENAIAASLDPDFQVLDLEADAEKQAVIDQVLDAWAAEQSQAFSEFIRHFKRADYGELLVALYDRIRRLGFDPDDSERLLRPAAGIEEVIGELRAQLPALRTPKPAGRIGRIDQVEACLDAASSANPNSVIAAVEAAKLAINRAHGEDLKLFREELKRLRRTAYDQLATPHRARVVELVARFHQAYSARKAALAALDFEDLERKTLDMLRASPELLRRTRARFDEILVDEYQDTSPLQHALIQLLAVGRRLFVVGDPAQSIYGFRSADPALFLQLSAAAKPGDGQIDLRQDFRSRPEIVAAVNVHFCRRFTETGTPFVRLEPGSGFDARPRPSVELLLTACEPGAGLAGGRPAEAARIALRLREMVEPGEDRAPLSITRYEQQRPIHYGDIAILFRSSTDIRIYEQALDDAGIPYFSETGRGFYHAQEVRDVIGLLRVLDNSRNQVAVAGALRSPMFGASDDALFLLSRSAHEHPGGSLSDAVENAEHWPADLPPADRETLGKYCTIVSELRARRPWLTLAGLIREIVCLTRYDTTLLLLPNGRRKLANVQKLSEVAAALETSGTSASLNEFISAVDRFRFDEVREGEAQLDASSEKAVRLLTMHGAKGLEFPVVVLPDLSRAPRIDRDFLDFHPDFGVGVQYNLAAPLEPADIVQPQILRAIRRRIDAGEAAERERVLFVGFTRAQEHLLLSACLKPNGKGVLAPEHGLKEIFATFAIGAGSPVSPDAEWRAEVVSDGVERLEASWMAAPQAIETVPVASQAIARRYGGALEAGASLGLPVDRKIEQQVEALAASLERPLPAPDCSDFIASATDITLWSACPRRYYLGRYLGYDFVGHSSLLGGEEAHSEPVARGGGDEPEVSRRDFGIAVHGFLAGEESAFERLPETQRAEAERLVATFRASEYGAGHGDVRRELPVMAKLGDRFLYGVLDLLRFEGLVPSLLLDYKTDRVDAAGVENLAGHYRAQMLVYARLIEAAFGARPRQAVLFFLDPGVPCQIELTDREMERAAKLIEGFFDAQRECAFPEHPGDQCRRCPFYNSLCMPTAQPTAAESCPATNGPPC